MMHFHSARAHYHRQWRFLTTKIKRLLAKDRFCQLQVEQQRSLIRQLRSLYRRMLRFERAKRLKKALGGAALLVGLGLGPNVQAQVNFGAPQLSPFGLGENANLRFNTLVDEDGDGDLDIISVRYPDPLDPDLPSQAIELWENTGTPEAAQFAAPIVDYGGIMLDASQSFGTPQLVDIDSDGDLDLFLASYLYDGDTYEYEAIVLYFENTGTAEAPVFAEGQMNPFGIGFGSNTDECSTAFADMDGDGDLDLLSIRYDYDYDTYETEYGFLYLENTGDATTPAFAAPLQEPFGLLSNDSTLLVPHLGDIDQDGDFDIIGTQQVDEYSIESNFVFIENTGDGSTPAFAAPVAGPFGLGTIVGLLPQPMLGDLDNDGDLDILTSDSYDLNTEILSWAYYENTTMVSTRERLPLLTDVKLSQLGQAGQYRLQLDDKVIHDYFEVLAYSLDGKLLQRQRLSGGQSFQTEVDLTAFPAGAYTIRLLSSQGQWSQMVTR